MSKYRGAFQEKVAKAFTKRKIDFQYETLKLPYSITIDFKPEFIFQRDDGHTINVMCFSDLTTEHRKELYHVVRQYPNMDLRIIFTNSRAVVSDTKQTYGEWANSQGLEWAQAVTISDIGGILKEWATE